MRRIHTDDVVAIAVDGVQSPPVGVVVDCDDDAIALDLYRWSVGRFDGPQMLIRRRDIRATVWAVPFTEDAMAEAGIYPHGEVVYDMDPLAEFQSKWRVA